MTAKKSEDKQAECPDTTVYEDNARLRAELQSKDQQIQGLKNIVKQVSELFGKMDAMMHTVSYDLENNSQITAGMKLRELSDVIATNQKVLYGITKEWKKE